MTTADLKRVEEAEFANPKLKFLSTKPKVYPSHKFSQPIVYEIGAWLIIIGSLLTLISLVFFLNSYLVVLFLSLILMAYLFLFIALPEFFNLRRLARRSRMSAQGDLRTDARDPVLYLRPFYYDFTSDPERLSGMTDEELLTSVLQDFGPVIAVGDPNEDESLDKSLPIIGATRVYLKGEDWQSSLKRLMSVSQLVVIHTGTSRGLIWEIEAAARQVKPYKLLISCLSWQSVGELARTESYRRFKQAAARGLVESDIRLPESLDDTILLAFNKDGTPQAVSINEWKRRLFYYSPSVLLRETLRPVFSERGLKLSRRSTVLYMIFMGLYGYGLATPALVWLWRYIEPQSQALGTALLLSLGDWKQVRDTDVVPGLLVAIFLFLPMFISYGLLVTVELYKGLRGHLQQRSSNIR